MQSWDKNSLTIRKEMFLLSFLFLILVLFLFASIFLKILFDHNMTSAKNSLRECNSQIVTYTEGMFHENAVVVDILARDDRIINASKYEFEEIVGVYKAIRNFNSNITYIYSGYENGHIYIDNYEIPIAFDATTRPWYVAAANTNGVARLVYSDAATGEWLFSQTRKLLDHTGRMVGAVTIDCSNQSISRQLSTKYQYASQRSFIVDPSARVLIHPGEKLINSTLTDYLDTATWNAIVSGRNNFAEYLREGVTAMAYFERIPETNFIVVTAIDASEVIGPIITSILALSLLSVGISMVLGFLLSRILVRRFARPIVALGSRIQSLAAGEPDQDWDIRFSNAEINNIAKSIEVIVKNIARREEQRKAAEYLSLHDSMTGLYNRRFFEEELCRLDVKRNFPLCLICCDVNGLKLVNDVFGHAEGDKLLIAVADCLARSLRSDDILARVGGDEFALILPRTNEGDAAKIIMRIKASFPRDRICGGPMAASLGFAIKSDKEQILLDVYHQADEIMYEQKLMESLDMKRRIVSSIIEAAKAECLIKPLSPEEVFLLQSFAARLCPDSLNLLFESYRLRKIGLCTLLMAQDSDMENLSKRHTETGYRLLSALDEYRNIAGCVLHYTEHWDGSGCPAGLSGRDIPLLSRIIAVAEAHNHGAGLIDSLKCQWYDPALLALLKGFYPEQQ